MTRYFLDTNCLIGLTFSTDVWNPDSRRLFDTDNTLYTSDNVVEEFCDADIKTQSEEREWDGDGGVFNRIRSRFRMGQLVFDQELQLIPDEELNSSRIADEFIQEFEIQDEAKRRIRRYFDRNLSDPDNVEAEEARQVANNLLNYILEHSEKELSRIQHRVKLGPSREGRHQEIGQRLQSVADNIHDEDVDVVLDAYHLLQRDILSKLVTADKRHVYGSRNLIQNIMGIRVLFLRDMFANSETAGDAGMS
ncbi:hypothetical protein [Natronomonas sp. EA1]|uniref:hypothetical protein n=1 Tax=Natronomonas sp. EA1 TaxID=3421655 RepID=UPI003EBD51BF